MQAYTPEIECEMKKFYQTLSEKDKRHYAAVEAIKLGMVVKFILRRYWVVSVTRLLRG
jgi:hypothetical protein